MQQFAGTSLKTRLYLLVLAAFVPVAVFIAFVAEEQKEIETQAIVHKTLVLARTAANEENQQLEATRHLLQTLAGAVLAIGGEPDKLSGLLEHLLKQAKSYADLGILTPDGRLLAGGTAPGSRRKYADSPWFRECLQRKDLVIGPYQGEHVQARPALYLALPAIGAGEDLQAVVFAALDLNWTNRAIFDSLAELPKGSRLTLLDETGGMLRHDTRTGGWSVPDNFDPSLHDSIVQRRSGALTAADETGLTRIYAFAPLASFFRERPVFIVLEVPKAQAFSASRRTTLRNALLLGLSALMAILAIWWVGDILILKRVRAMVAATRKLAHGDLSARIGGMGAKDELSHLAGVLDEMAASLQMRIERETRVKASLEQSREQLRRLGAYQQEVREQERIRIARELHDQLGQSLTILKMDLSWLRKQMPDAKEDLQDKIAGMFAIIDETLKNLHGVTAELRPVILDDFGLVAAMQWQIEEFQNRSKIACRFENDDGEPDLPKDQATALFRIFQEILTNIIRHARADAVAVRLQTDGDALTFQVEDNGRGITEDEINAPRSFGLLGMRERLYPWNGSATFEGRPGQGTCVTIRLPLQAKGDPP